MKLGNNVITFTIFAKIIAIVMAADNANISMHSSPTSITFLLTQLLVELKNLIQTFRLLFIECIIDDYHLCSCVSTWIGGIIYLDMHSYERIQNTPV
jgi:hypothetical protein